MLEVRGLTVNYGPIQAVRGIDLDVEEGQIVALLGANGAGKTTTLRAISGVLRPSGGTITLNGVAIGRRASKVARQGVRMSPEGRLIFYGLTVEENLRAGGYTLKDKGRMHQNLRRIYQLFPVLEQRHRQQASTLSGGEQQMLAIGRALMGDPKILLLDEPSLGLAPLVIQDIFRVLQEIRREGTTILIVEQNALATLRIADYAYVLELGLMNMSGKASDLIQDSRLIEAYLGGKKA
ncbi:MAG TPA: ABC transporter ATP-binding protein [Candidatus Enterenecus stercoripullorum]|nr:ABC transporter ATP-binding protein [Candidatus Enterenecus stercoripullorum]